MGKLRGHHCCGKLRDHPVGKLRGPPVGKQRGHPVGKQRGHHCWPSKAISNKHQRRSSPVLAAVPHRGQCSCGTPRPSRSLPPLPPSPTPAAPDEGGNSSSSEVIKIMREAIRAHQRTGRGYQGPSEAIREPPAAPPPTVPLNCNPVAIK